MAFDIQFKLIYQGIRDVFRVRSLSNELINTHYMEQIIKPLTIRSAQPHLNAQQVKELPMVLATLEEQNNFAEVIEQIDKHKLLIID